MKIKKFFLIIVCLICSGNVIYAQNKKDSLLAVPDKVFGFCVPSLNENPAGAGFFNQHCLNISGFALSPEMPEYPYSGGISYDAAPLKSKRWGIGADYSYYRFSNRKINSGTLAFSYLKKCKENKMYLRAGVSLSYIDHSNDYKSAYYFGDMVDPVYGFVYATSDMYYYHKDTSEYAGVYPNAGVCLYGKNFLLGISAKNIFQIYLEGDSAKVENKPGYLSKPSIRESFAYSIVINSSFSVIPKLDLNISQHGFTTIPAVMLSWKKMLMCSLSYTPYRAIYTGIGFQWKNRFMFTASSGFCLDKEVREAFGLSGINTGLRIQL
ncbi:MAG: type IX secretion system membrane protein PorP/SprF [Bacteroidota bacterium]